MKAKIWSSLRHAGTAAAAILLVLLAQDAMGWDFGSWNVVIMPVLSGIVRFASKFVVAAAG